MFTTEMGKNIQLIILILFMVLNITKSFREKENISTNETTPHIPVDQRVGKPENLSIAAISTTELNVTWNHPEGERPSYYLVKWVDDDSLNENVPITTNYVIENLDPCTVYNVDVVSVDSDDNESVPAEGTGKTNPTEPPQPANFTIDNLTSDSATVSWEKPEYECNVLNFSITWEWKPYWGDGQQGGEDQGMTSDLEFEIENLDPYSSLIVCVTSMYENIEGAPACDTGDTEQGPPGPPVILEATSGYGSSTVKWDAPENENGIIENYSITWKTSDADKNTTTVGTTTSVTLQLEPCKSYIITVSAKTAADEWGPPSDEAEVDILSNAIPESVSCSASENNLKVDWIHKYSCPVENYKIFWESFVFWSSSNNSDEIVIDGSLQTYEQKGSYNTHYKVCIGTLSEGLDSDEVVCCQMETDEGVPSEPHIEEIQQEYLNAHITWKPPDQHNGIITTYEIIWRSNNGEVGYVDKTGTEREAIFALDICETYELTVTAETSTGSGNESSPVSLIMENYVPANMVSCTKGPGGSVTVSWNTASSCTVSGFLVEYNWHSLWSEEQGSNSQNVGPSNINLTVLEAEPYSQFGACVGVGNSLDEDSCCEIVTNQEVPGPSENMTCEMITASVANISWIEPTEINGVLGDWLLTWSTEDDEPFNVTLDSETYDYVLHGLLHNADYNVTLQASTAAGFGEESSCIVVTPPPPPSGSNAGAIAGGIIGAILGIILIACVVYFVMKRKTYISGKVSDARTMIARRKRERDERAGKDKKSTSMSPGETNQENIPAPAIYGEVPLPSDQE